MADLKFSILPSVAVVHGPFRCPSPSSTLSRRGCSFISPLCPFSARLRNLRGLLVVSFKNASLHLFLPRSNRRVNMLFKNGQRDSSQFPESCFCWDRGMANESQTKSSKRDAKVLKFAQQILKDLILLWSLCCKTFHIQLLYSRVLQHPFKLIPSIHQHSKPGFVLLTSMMAALLLMLGAPLNTPSSTWALTEENLIFLEAWRTIDRAYVDKTFNGQSWFRYREQALKREPMTNREQTCVPSVYPF